MRSVALALLLTIVCVIAVGANPDRPESASAVVESIPAEAAQRKNPIRATAEAVENGGLVFSSQCTMCHGTTGKADGSLVARLKLTIPDFTDPTVRERRTDGELFYILTEGHGRMPGEGKRLSDETKWNMIHFIRSLSAGASQK